jgi:RNA polymerase sigma-32 factor
MKTKKLGKNTKRSNKDAIIPEVVAESSSKKNEEAGVSSDLIIEPEEGDLNSLISMPSKDLVPITPKKDDPLGNYLQEISRYPLLNIEQERALVKSLNESGDIEIAKKLVVHNLRLVVKIAMEYRSTWQNVMDLIQEGNIGLMKAVSKYDPEKGAKLSYYASWWIKSYILKFILDNFRLVKIGTTNEQKKLFYNLMREKNRLEAQGIAPDAKLISENLGVSEKAVVTMDQRLSSSGQEVSMDAPLRSGEDGGSRFGDFLEDEDEDLEGNVAQEQELGLLKENLEGFVEGLKERDREIFKKRLLNEAPLSLQAIGDQYGISRERVRQIEERLLKGLKVYMSKFIR